MTKSVQLAQLEIPQVNIDGNAATATALSEGADRNKLDGIATGAQVNTVTSVASKTGVVTLTKADVGLSNVDNTSDETRNYVTATLGNKTIRGLMEVRIALTGSDIVVL